MGMIQDLLIIATQLKLFFVLEDTYRHPPHCHPHPVQFHRARISNDGSALQFTMRHCPDPGSARLMLSFLLFAVSGRSSAYGDTTAEGHPAGPGSVSSSTGAISTTTGQQEGDGSEGEGEGEAEGDVHTSNR